MSGCYDCVQREFQACSVRDHFQLLGQPETAEEAEEPIGLRILEFYVSLYLRSNARHLRCQEKKALRLCCKSLKAWIDATLTYAYIGVDDNYLSFNGEQPLSDIEKPPPHAMVPNAMIPNSFRSLDILCHTFPSLKTLIMNPIVRNSKPFKDSCLTDSLGHLTSLTELYLMGFNGEGRGLVLPQSFSQLTALKILTLEASMNGIAPLQHCTSLTLLQLFLDRDYEEIPEFVCNLTSLEDLCFVATGDPPCSVPTGISNLKQLTCFQLGINNVNELPESLGHLSSLEVLALSIRKGLSHLPKSFGNLTALKDLEIDHCPFLEAVPDTLGNLKQLTKLNLSKCFILKEIPSTIGDLHRLKHLKVHCCSSLTTLPDSVGNLKSLVIFRLLRCPSIKSLPDSFTKLTSLRIFTDLPLGSFSQNWRPCIGPFR